jgi:hypothetical protein
MQVAMHILLHPTQKLNIKHRVQVDAPVVIHILLAKQAQMIVNEEQRPTKINNHRKNEKSIVIPIHIARQRQTSVSP